MQDSFAVQTAHGQLHALHDALLLCGADANVKRSALEHDKTSDFGVIWRIDAPHKAEDFRCDFGAS